MSRRTFIRSAGVAAVDAWRGVGRAGFLAPTGVKGLEKLTQLTDLFLEDNPNLTKAQIDELQKVLPKCRIISNPKK